MECPLCGREFPRTMIDYHAWNCSGRRCPSEGALNQEKAASSALIQAINNQQTACAPDPDSDEVGSAFSSETSVVPHCSTEKFQEAEEVHECPLCFCSFSADLILEHAVFCNGPSYGGVPERGTSSYTEPREQAIPSGSQDVGQGAPSEVTSNVMQVFHSYINGKEPMVPSTPNHRVARSSQQEDGISRHVEKIVQYLEKVQSQLDKDSEFNDLLQPLLKSNQPLEILQLLVKSLFCKNGSKSIAPFALFFYLLKLFLPKILAMESWTVFMKWLEVFIPDVVVPWITKMGGWEVVLCALGALLAGGLLVGFTVLLTRFKSKQ